MINSCRLVSQSDYLNNSNKDCDWLLLVCFVREQCTADTTFTLLKNKGLKIQRVRGEIIKLFILKQEKHETQSSVFPYALLLPACFKTEQSTAEASLFVKYDREY